MAAVGFSVSRAHSMMMLMLGWLWCCWAQIWLDGYATHAYTPERSGSATHTHTMCKTKTRALRAAGGEATVSTAVVLTSCEPVWAENEAHSHSGSTDAVCARVRGREREEERRWALFTCFEPARVHLLTCALRRDEFELKKKKSVVTGAKMKIQAVHTLSLYTRH